MPQASSPRPFPLPPRCLELYNLCVRSWETDDGRDGFAASITRGTCSQSLSQSLAVSSHLLVNHVVDDRARSLNLHHRVSIFRTFFYSAQMHKSGSIARHRPCGCSGVMWQTRSARIAHNVLMRNCRRHGRMSERVWENI